MHPLSTPEIISGNTFGNAKIYSRKKTVYLKTIINIFPEENMR